MKKLILALVFTISLLSSAISQTKTFLDQPYLEVSGYADTLIASSGLSLPQGDLNLTIRTRTPSGSPPTSAHLSYNRSAHGTLWFSTNPAVDMFRRACRSADKMGFVIP